MKDLSRAEIGRVIELKTEGVILGTAMLFLAAGSLWAHFALGSLFFEPPFILSWILIHGGSFLCLSMKRLQRFLPLSGLAALQLFFYSSLKNYDMPFFPMAPMFFLVATLALTSFPWGRARAVVTFWALGWASTVFWLDPLQGSNQQAKTALFVGMALNLFFVGIFILSLRFFSKRMRALVEGLGPHQRFDDQRIHAARLSSLGEIAAGLAHEIQNPLTSISGYSYQIQEDLKDGANVNLAVIKAANDRIKVNVDRMVDITKVMKGFAREGHTEDFGRLSVKGVIQETLLLMKHNVKSSGIDLQLELPERDGFVLGSSVQLGQVLVNLLANARDACQGCDRKKITLGFKSEGENVELWVEDTGPGIDAKLKKDVFRAFFTTKPAGVGTGLGLYIAGIITARHKGSLRFECPRDGAGRILGTRFVLTLKAAAEGAGAGDGDQRAA